MQEKKLKKPKRVDLVNDIIRKAGLSPGKDTFGYFTRNQLMELNIQLDKYGNNNADKQKEK